MRPSLLVFLTGLMLIAAPRADAQARPRFLNPSALSTPRGYSHVVEVPPGQRMIFLSGQVPLDSAGNLVGPGDFRAQTRQVFENLRVALAAVGATFRDVVKLNYYILDAGNLAALREVRAQFLDMDQPPASTLAEVKGLFRADVLVEVEAIAIVPR